MGRPALILAALAADAAPGKNFRGIRKLDLNPNLDELLLRDDQGNQFNFRIPANPQGEGELAVERTVLRTLSIVASSLPFEIASEIGTTRDVDGTQGVVFSSVEGNEPDLAKLPPGAFSKTLADALAAIHSLPLSTIRDAGLPEYDSTAQLHRRVAELDQIAALGRVPAAVLTRWENALEDVGLFRYHATVVHGSIGKDSLKLEGQRVVGVTGFENLRISDPAEDLSWIVGAGLGSTVDDTILHYRAARQNADENLLQRATLYSELELGSWLVHCVESGDPESISQAEDMISDLRDQLEAGSLRDLRAASFAGLVAGSSLLPEITNSIPQVTSSEPQESDVELETATESELETVEEKSQEPNPDELF